MPDNVFVVFQSALEIGRFDIANAIMAEFLKGVTVQTDFRDSGSTPDTSTTATMD